MKRRIPIWAWFFIVLGVLSAIAATIEIWFNLSQQLTPDQVQTAQQLWREHAPEDYDLDYLLSWREREPILYQATVRNREVTAVTVAGGELEPVLFPLHDLPPLFDAVTAWLAEDPSRRDGTVDYTAAANGSVDYRVEVHRGETVVKRNGRTLAAKLAGHYVPEVQFAAITRQLEIDHQPDAGRVFCVGTFSRKTGMLLRYVRSLSSTRERVEIGAKEFEGPEKP
jgi:hypothetical protein